MIASGNTIRKLGIFKPFSERSVAFGMSYGLSVAGYDIRLGDVAKTAKLSDGRWFIYNGVTTLASSLEHITVPNNMLCYIKDKSTLARDGLKVQNTVAEPGWFGHLTLELTYEPVDNKRSFTPTVLRAAIELHLGQPIAQLIFHYLDQSVDGYQGKYQDQPAEPVEAKYE